MDKTRYNRLAQAKHRKSKRSYKTELENAQILLAWMNADLSEGQVSRILGVDRIAVREMRDNAIAEGLRLAEKLRTPLDATYEGICAPFDAGGVGK